MAAAVIENLGTRDIRLSTAVVVPARQKVRLEGKAFRVLVKGRGLARHYMARKILDIQVEKSKGGETVLERLKLTKADRASDPGATADKGAENAGSADEGRVHAST